MEKETTEIPEIPEMPPRTGDKSEYVKLVKLLKSITVTEEAIKRNMTSTTSVRDGKPIMFYDGKLSELLSIEREIMARLEELRDV